jgi:hypothetical protein
MGQNLPNRHSDTTFRIAAMSVIVGHRNYARKWTTAAVHKSRHAGQQV